MTFENTSWRMAPKFFSLWFDNIYHQSKIQNSAARLITGTRKLDTITPVLRNLHWLPLEKMIIFKINVLTFCTMHDTAPKYLADLLHTYSITGTASVIQDLIVSVARPRFDSYGNRVFFCFCSIIVEWTAIYYITGEQILTSFKTKLKTNLISEAYPQGQ